MKIGQATHWASVMKTAQLKSYVRCEVAFGKRAPGAGFQVALELAGRSFIIKFELDDEPPWSVCRGVPARPRVVPLEAPLHTGGDPDIMALRGRCTLKDINDSQRICSHAFDIAGNNPNWDRPDREQFFSRVAAVRRDWRFGGVEVWQKLKSAFARFASYGVTDFAWRCLA